MQEIPFYQGIKQIIYDSDEPFTVKFISFSISKNEGGEEKILENQLEGPLRKNHNENLMIGLKDADDEENVKHIYLHSIIELINSTGHFKLVL